MRQMHRGAEEEGDHRGNSAPDEDTAVTQYTEEAHDRTTSTVHEDKNDDGDKNVPRPPLLGRRGRDYAFATTLYTDQPTPCPSERTSPNTRGPVSDGANPSILVPPSTSSPPLVVPAGVGVAAAVEVGGS